MAGIDRGASADDAENPFTAYLNEPQAEAVATKDGPLLVFAGAGSGKTRVITFRVANLIATHRVPPYRILAVTFTNKAANEMRERLAHLLGADVAQDCWVGTFHAVCARLLRRFGEAVGLTKDFLIYDDADQRAVVNRCIKELGYDDKRYPPKLVHSRIMKEKQEGRRAADFSSDSYLDDAIGKLFTAYEAHLKAANAVDFEDLLGHVMRLAEDPNSLAGRDLRDRFNYVLVDEFQDCNQVQYRLVRALARNHDNLCVVGDDDQSIYRWRGGDVALIRNFKRDYPTAKVVKLEENYRSTKNVVGAALAIIKKSREREPKELFTSKPEGDKVAVVTARDERDEALHAVSEVKRFLAGGAAPKDVAVFYRIHAMSRVLEEVMRIEKVPYRIVGGLRFFDRAEVKDLLAYLRVILNPRSDVDLLRIVNVPARGIGGSTIDKVTEIARDRGTSVYDAIDIGTDEASGIGTGPRKKLASFRELMEKLRREQATASVRDLALSALSESGYIDALKAEDSADADARLGNLEELVASIGEYEIEAKSAGLEPSLAGYLERVTLSSSADDGDPAGKVSLMSVHSAKGLEFDYVVLLGMEEELFPYVRRGEEEEMDEEEERRLAYVAVTRAKRRLVLTHATMRTLYGNTRDPAASRFLFDIPEAMTERRLTAAAREKPIGSSGLGPFRGNAAGGNRSSFGSSSYGGGRPNFAAPRGPSWSARSGFGGSSPRPKEEPARAPGERYVERDADVSTGEGIEIRRGSKVSHQRFGVGTVQSVDGGSDPSVTVMFPAWGPKKVLVRFLQPA